jgi:hypothetical protein
LLGERVYSLRGKVIYSHLAKRIYKGCQVLKTEPMKISSFKENVETVYRAREKVELGRVIFNKIQ